jgi:hypothetical protein
VLNTEHRWKKSKSPGKRKVCASSDSFRVHPAVLPGNSGFVILLFMIFNHFQIKFLDKEAMVKLGSSAGVGAGVDLKEKEEVKGGQSTASSAFTISLQIVALISA